MKLTIIRLDTFSDQDRICLGKIWPGVTAADLPLDDTHRLYAARFNERLLAAVRVTLDGNQGTLDDLCVREITRRRGVGQYLIEEVLHDNPQGLVLQAQIHAFKAQLLGQGGAGLGVFAYQQALGHFHLGDLAAKALEGLTQLTANRPATQHQQALRPFAQGPDVV